MRQTIYRTRTALLIACFCSFLLIVPSPAQNSSKTPGATSSPSAASHPTANNPTAAEIAAAKASGKVWVNLETGIYHKRGRWYGKTKNGKFMTVDEAKKAGYKPAKRE